MWKPIINLSISNKLDILCLWHSKMILIASVEFGHVYHWLCDIHLPPQWIFWCSWTLAIPIKDLELQWRKYHCQSDQPHSAMVTFSWNWHNCIISRPQSGFIHASSDGSSIGESSSYSFNSLNTVLMSKVASDHRQINMKWLSSRVDMFSDLVQLPTAILVITCDRGYY
jgi:hypothetical protein